MRANRVKGIGPHRRIDQDVILKRFGRVGRALYIRFRRGYGIKVLGGTEVTKGQTSKGMDSAEITETMTVAAHEKFKGVETRRVCRRREKRIGIS
jgi:hypothetical protein